MFRVQIKMMESKPADVARDAWRAICRDSMVEVAGYWKREMLPKHFTANAKGTYGHDLRSKKYRDSKKNDATRGKAIMGGVVDNVYTGASMRKMLGRAAIRGFPTRARLYLNVPFYFDIKFNRATVKRDGTSNRPSRQPDKPSEITAKTVTELKELRKVIRAFVTKRLQNYRGARKTTTV